MISPQIISFTLLKLGTQLVQAEDNRGISWIGGGFRDVEENSSEYDNESVEISDDDPEDDPDVQDIRWF